MPLQKPEDFGTNADGSSIRDYCRYCYQKGKFADPKITKQQMIDKVASMAAQMNLPPDQARKMAEATIPNLKRWSRHKG